VGRARQKGVPFVLLGVGFDLLENSRFEQELTRGEWSSHDGIFTPKELSQCNSARKPALSYAACFAAKEATLKAMGRQVSDLAIFREVEVEFRQDGAHRIVLHDRLREESKGLGVRRIHFSIARSASQTGAMVILEN